MLTLRFILSNLGRHRLRNVLTIAGIAVSLLAFGLLRTAVDAWYAGVEASSASRLVTRNAISLIFSLPIAYKERVRAVEGVEQISWGNWFGGYWQDEKNFFANFAVDGRTYLALYPEYALDEGEKLAFLRDRKGCVIGHGLARRFGWKVGDAITLKGTIFKGDWEMVVRGIYKGAQPNTDVSQLFFHWDYLNETLRKKEPARADQTGFIIIGVRNITDVAPVSLAVDAGFRNSRAETLTETERAFQLGFVAMSGAIVTAVQMVSGIVVVVILAVAANTMAMSARERMSEFATLKVLGFGGGYLVLLVVGESLTIAALGGIVGGALTVPVVQVVARALSDWFPVFMVTRETLLLQAGVALLVGVVSGGLPAVRARTVRIADALGRAG